MTTFEERLKDTLSHAYEIERELGGGGMSRVFVATDRSLGRRVVIKLLSPELTAGVNSERFRHGPGVFKLDISIVAGPLVSDVRCRVDDRDSPSRRTPAEEYDRAVALYGCSNDWAYGADVDVPASP